LKSQACLIGSRLSLRGNRTRLEQVRQLVERIEAEQEGRAHHSLVANIPGSSVEEVGKRVASYSELAGIQGPTISPVWDTQEASQEGILSPPVGGRIDRMPVGATGWFAVNIIVSQKELLLAVDHLRHIGASSITVSPVQYTFYAQSKAYTNLLKMLED
jgi:ATP phosphoribosyltransferase